ncbi:MAG: DMT family transporter, partial [Pseudomonadota bacterium]
AMSVAVRATSVEIDSRVLVLLRAVIVSLAILPVLPWIWGKLRISRPWLHVSRGALIGIATHLGFYALVNLPLATAAVLFFTAPIFATLLAILTQGEQVGPRRWAAIGAGFAGAMIILRPGFQDMHPAMIMALLSSACFALALNQSRALAEADGPTAAYVSSVVMTVLVSLPVAMPHWSLPTSWLVWGAVAIVVLGGVSRGIADIQAYRYADASILAPFTYLRLVFVGLGGYFFFAEVPDRYTWIGAAIIVAATLYITQRERHLAKSRNSDAA